MSAHPVHKRKLVFGDVDVITVVTGRKRKLSDNTEIHLKKVRRTLQQVHP